MSRRAPARKATVTNGHDPNAQARLLARLRARLGAESVLASDARLLPYESDAMPLYRRSPGFVVLPGDGHAVVDIVKLLHASGAPWSPRGAGTGLAGGALPEAGGGVISLARMRRILDIDERGRRARVEAGVVNLALDRALAGRGFMFAPDPSSQTACTIGGNIATNAGGPHTLKYGVTAEHLLGVRLVLADGTVIDLGGAEETMAGYDLLGLLCGSEGTFGLVLEATVRLTPLPEATRTFLAAFDDLTDASRAVTALLGASIVPSALELIDGAVLSALTEAFDLRVPEAAALLIGEIDGLAEAVDPQLDLAIETLRRSGGHDIRCAGDAAEREQLWTARKKTFAALGRVAPGYLSHDAVIPRSMLPNVLTEIRAISERFELPVVNVFHAGDGNLHPAVLFDVSDPNESARAREAGQAILRACLSAGGVLSGEHGIGLSKREAMRAVYTTAELRLMDSIRRMFDPWNLSNPKRVLPQGTPDAEHLAASNDSAAAVDGWTYGDDALSSPHPLSQTEGMVGARDDREPEAFEAEIGRRLRQAAGHWETLLPLGGGTLVVSPAVGEPLPLAECDRILRFDPDDTTVTVEPGVRLAVLADMLDRHGHCVAWEAPDPEHATLGGLVASGYWSSRTLGLGHPKSSLLGFRAVMGTGEVIEYGARVMKNVSGYNLARLMVGSRGTLAVMTKLILRTHPKPREEALLVLDGSFADLLAIAESLQPLPLGWTQLDVLAGDEGSALLIGLDGFPQEAQRRRHEAEQAAARILRGRMVGDQTTLAYVAGDESRAQRSRAADWLGWREATLILRLVVAPHHGIALAERAHELTFGHAITNGERAWACRLQAHPALGLVRVAFSEIYDEPAMRRLMLSLADAVREMKGYRALDRAPEDFWWGWDPWGFRHGLAERMRRMKLVFDPRGVLAPWTVEGWARGA